MQATSNAGRLLTLACLVLAGCSAPEAGTAPIEADFEELELEASDTTGILRGVVIDEAIRPILGVLITARGGASGANLTMQTAEDGLFGFDGLEPGTYFVTASKLGFGTVQSSAEVQAGVADPAPVKIQMVADPSTAPHVVPYHMDGFMACSVRPMFIAYQCPGLQDNILNANYEMPTPPTWIQSEMTWESTQATGDELSLAINCYPGDQDPAKRCESGQTTITRSEGKSPLIATINETYAANWTLGGPDGNPLSISIFVYGRSDLDAWNEQVIYDAQKPATGNDCLHWPQVGGYPFAPGTCMRATGPGAVLNQKIDVYTNIFFGFTPDEGWSFLDDGPHTVPS